MSTMVVRFVPRVIDCVAVTAKGSKRIISIDQLRGHFCHPIVRQWRATQNTVLGNRRDCARLSRASDLVSQGAPQRACSIHYRRCSRLQSRVRGSPESSPSLLIARYGMAHAQTRINYRFFQSMLARRIV